MKGPATMNWIRVNFMLSILWRNQCNNRKTTMENTNKEFLRFTVPHNNLIKISVFFSHDLI